MTIELNGDKALKGAAEDRLGFAAIAEAIAASLVTQPKVDGLVLGIEGRWGSGKSSLINMMLDAIRDVGAEVRPEIVEFKPWLIGDRDGLLLALFSELATAVDSIEEAAGDASGRHRRELGNAGEQVRRFAARLGGVGKAAKLAGAIIPAAGLVGEAIESVADFAKALENGPSLAAEKARLRDRLGSLPRRIVVTIDDVDRLEPSEVVELLRLVRSVADFPNVVYVLCYDPVIVAHSIEVAAQIDNGRAYIEKIVQLPISVPQPEAFDLRRWFGAEIDSLPMAPDEAGASMSRLSGVIDIEGGRYLSTPRHVVRCMDGIRFFWSALQGQVDLADLVWLHLVKVGNPKLYDWIEKYLPETAAQASGMAMIRKEAKQASRKRLDAALEAEEDTFEVTRDRLAEFLPGIDAGFNFGNDDEPGIYLSIAKEELARAARARALASPDHYRLYFAVEQPRNSPRHADFEELFAALDASVAETCKLLSRWNGERQSTGTTKAEAMLDRIVGGDGAAFAPQRAETLLVALADRLDDLVVDRDKGFGDPLIWTEGRRVLRWLLPTLGERRKRVVSRLFEGRAFGWLTSLFRSELFAHGRVEEHRSGQPLLEPQELDQVCALMLARYRKMDFEAWKQIRRPLSALFAWHQGGDPDGPRAMISGIAETDEGLVDVLGLLSGQVRSSDGEYLTLKESTLRYFLDYRTARARIESLAREASDPTLRSRADDLAQNFKFGDQF